MASPAQRTASVIPTNPVPQLPVSPAAQCVVQVQPASEGAVAGPAPAYGAAPCCPPGGYPSSCYVTPPALAPPWCPDQTCGGGWRPPGIRCPWPEDEYLCDGGDKIPSVKVRDDWSVKGLQLEDTVVHFDTLNGETHVEPSNRVCIYAPRFASVRKVYGAIQYDHLDRIARVDQPIPVDGVDDVQKATTTVQPVQPVLNHGLDVARGMLDRTPPMGLENRQGLVGIQDQVLPYQDILELPGLQLVNSEKARLAEMIQAAAVWNHDTPVQVVIDNIATHEEVTYAGVGALHIYCLEGKPRLRVCKLASRKEARPGEEIEFTLQFENVGDQTIGNVTVIDNLTTRLEYVEDSQSSSLQANFSTADNDGASLTLRWEINEPMKVGQSGVIRFKCRVR